MTPVGSDVGDEADGQAQMGSADMIMMKKSSGRELVVSCRFLVPGVLTAVPARHWSVVSLSKDRTDNDRVACITPGIRRSGAVC